MLQRAWREDIRAMRAKTFLESSLELKSFREEVGAWVVGGALPPSPLRARRSDSPEVATGPAALVFIVFHCARAKGSVPRGSARRSTQAWKRCVERPQSNYTRASRRPPKFLALAFKRLPRE